MPNPVAALVNVGVGGDTSASDRRRIQTINVVALLAIGLNAVFSTYFFLFIDSSGSWPLRGAMLGHKHASMTLDVYGHLYTDDLEAIADRLDGVLRAAA